MSFIDSGLIHIGRIIKTLFLQWEFASKNALFQRIDARIKLIFLVSFIIIISLKNEIHTQIFITIFIFSLMLLSRLNPIVFYKKILILWFIFGFLIILPSAFNVITEGRVVLPILMLSKSYDVWIYHIPQIIGFTNEGIVIIVMFTLRIINSLSLSFLIVYTTPFHEIIKALKVFKIPDTILMIVILSYSYIFIFSKTVEEIYLAKKARTLIRNNDKESRQWIAGRVAYIFRKTQQRYEDIFKAMLSRGFANEIMLYNFKKINIYNYIIALLLFSLELYCCFI
ncbi:MAG: cobalt ECF transporter T component CbiQ [Dissulfurimicrobium sp.]|uniref:cobalt ECF transporter T component CbiQ n=1 Tax=Dissulfurimicrobium TaxID=1769732 RepID=UPI003C753EC6